MELGRPRQWRCAEVGRLLKGIQEGWRAIGVMTSSLSHRDQHPGLDSLLVHAGRDGMDRLPAGGVAAGGDADVLPDSEVAAHGRGRGRRHSADDNTCSCVQNCRVHTC